MVHYRISQALKRRGKMTWHVTDLQPLKIIVNKKLVVTSRYELYGTDVLRTLTVYGYIFRHVCEKEGEM